MYLSMLTEKQKEYFLKLAYQMALIDNNLSENEKIMMESYCNEMQIPVPENIREESIDEIIESMRSEATVVEKKIMIFEILGLALADGSYDEVEKEIIQKALNAFGLDKAFGDFCEKKVSEYLNIQEELNLKILS